MIGTLPHSLSVGGKDYPINADFRNILTFFEACGDPELSEEEKLYILLRRLYGSGLKEITGNAIREAAERARWFVDCGKEEKDRIPRKLIDWEQDASLIFPAVNRVAGREVRSADFIHWWTFAGYFMEIDGGTFSTVLSIRQKKSRGKKLEQWEKEFYRQNKELCDLRKRYTAEEQEEIDYWERLMG